MSRRRWFKKHFFNIRTVYFSVELHLIIDKINNMVNLGDLLIQYIHTADTGKIYVINRA